MKKFIDLPILNFLIVFIASGILLVSGTKISAQAYYVDVDPLTPGLQSTYSIPIGSPAFIVDVYMISPGPASAVVFDMYAVAIEYNDVPGILTAVLPNILDATAAGITTGALPPDIITGIVATLPIGPGAPLISIGVPPGAIGASGPFTASDGGSGTYLSLAPPLTPPIAPFFGGPGGYPLPGVPILLHNITFMPTTVGITDVAPIGLLPVGVHPAFPPCPPTPLLAIIPPGGAWPIVAEVMDYWGGCFGAPAAFVPSVPPFPPITPGVITVTAVVPIEIIMFEAKVKGHEVILYWETASEVNNKGFEIQHLEKNREGLPFTDWETIGFVSGAHTSTTIQSYTYTISDLQSGKHFFRLKQIDIDGLYAFSEHQSVELDMRDIYHLGEAYPNPSKDVITIPIELAKGQNVIMEVFDSKGQLVSNAHNGLLGKGRSLINFNASELLPGVYSYRITGEAFSEMKQFMITQ